MNKLNKFNDYLLDKIFENNSEVAIVLSDRLYALLGNIDHPISKKLKLLNNVTTLGDKATLIDYDDDNKSKFTYTVPSKMIDFFNPGDAKDHAKLLIISRSFPELWTKHRNPSNIGKVINKIFPGEFATSGKPGEDIPSFTNNVVLERTKSEESFLRFKIVEGNDINKYYDEDSYNPTALYGSTLGGSCMRYEKCKSFIDFYSKNKGVKLVVLFSDDKEHENKIIGRSLLWDIEYIDGKKVDRKYMDRIYYIYESDMMLFKEFARKNGWLCKKNQNMYSSESIVDTVNGLEGKMNLTTTSTFAEMDRYPYLDTLKYFVQEDGYLTNNSNTIDEEYITLTNTNGLYEESGEYEDDEYEDDEVERIYVEYYEDSFPVDDLQWCDLGEEWRLPDDAVWIDNTAEYATTDYIDDNMVQSEYEGGYIERDEAVLSEYLEDYIIRDDAIKILPMESSNVETLDDVNEDDDSDFLPKSYANMNIEYIKPNSDSIYFWMDNKNNFIKTVSLKYNKLIYAHKIWDKDKIFKYNGKYYLNDGDAKLKDDLIGQTRLF